MNNTASDQTLEAWLDRQLKNQRQFCLGVCGAQGSGKSTLARQLAEHCRNQGKQVAILSLDDLYLPRSIRHELARAVHPLLQTRGVPGTHDVAQGLALLQGLRDLRAGESLALPRFDKANDDPYAQQLWPQLSGPIDLIVFEGWCIGLAPQSPSALQAPINELERKDDSDARWRRWVNQQLAREYQDLWAQLDALIYLQIPDWPSVLRWRSQQEQHNAANGGQYVMDSATLKRFVQHYERLTQHALATLPMQATVLRKLGPEHEVLSQDIRT